MPQDEEEDTAQPEGPALPTLSRVVAGTIEWKTDPTRPEGKIWTLKAIRAPEKKPPSFDLRRAVVSEAFREFVLAAYPVLREDETYRRLMGYLLLGGIVDRDTRRLLLHAGILAQLEGREQEYSWRKYNAGDFLRRFRQDVLPAFEWAGADQRQGQCRQLIRSGVASEVEHALADELRVSIADLREPVLFDTGEPYRPNKSPLHLTQDGADPADRDLAQVEPVTNDPTRRVIEHMNGLPPHSFTKALKNLSEAYQAAESLGDEASTRYALEVLRHVQLEPKPQYQESSLGRTSRAWGTGYSILGLPREVRWSLTKGWIELDLKSAHLAIAGRLWGVPVVLDFLQRGESIWDGAFDWLEKYERTEIQGSTSAEIRRSVKGAFKQVLYALVYGAAKKNLVTFGGDTHKGETNRTALTRFYDAPVDRVGRRLLKHPVFAALYEARGRYQRLVREAGGVRDAFGTPIYIDSERNVRSVMSQQAQSYELDLLLPVLDLAEDAVERAAKRNRSPDWRLTLWQHDGVSIKVSNKSKRPKIVRQIQSVVQHRADELGIPTRLEAKYL